MDVSTSSITNNMNDPAALRSQLRAQNGIAFGCLDCVYLGQCRGTQADGRFDCFACRGDFCQSCTRACPYQPQFPALMREIAGFDWRHLPAPCQRAVHLTHYIPVIYHSYRRVDTLGYPIVAVPLYDLFCIRNGRYTAIAESPEELRMKFKLAQGTRIIARGTDKDKLLERFWAHRRRDDVVGQLARMGLMAVIPPNFSHFLDAPRTDNLFNRKRQLICLSELSAAGIPVIPHLSAAGPGDWTNWGEYLAAYPNISVVAVEFQTGNKNRNQGMKVIREIAKLQQTTCRQIHVILIGGAQFATDAAAMLRHVTILDGRPFMNAMKRRVFETRTGKWRLRRVFSWAALDEHLAEGVSQYSDWIGERLITARRRKAV